MCLIHLTAPVSGILGSVFGNFGTSRPSVAAVAIPTQLTATGLYSGYCNIARLSIMQNEQGTMDRLPDSNIDCLLATSLPMESHQTTALRLATVNSEKEARIDRPLAGILLTLS